MYVRVRVCSHQPLGPSLCREALETTPAIYFCPDCVLHRSSGQPHVIFHVLWPLEIPLLLFPPAAYRFPFLVVVALASPRISP